MSLDENASAGKKPVVFTEAAVQALAATTFDPNWLLTFESGNAPRGVSVTETEAAIYVVVLGASSLDRLLILDRDRSDIFQTVHATDRRTAFDRCVRAALRCFGRHVALNPAWRPFHAGRLLSFFATDARSSNQRIVVEANPADFPHVLICGIFDAGEIRDLGGFQPSHEAFNRAIGDLSEGLRAAKETPLAEGGVLDLDDVIPSNFVKGFTYNEWYPLQLSKQQLQFVDSRVDGPLRLRGAAGTGKTLAMVIKALKTVYDAEDNCRALRLLFVTHSWSAAEAVESNVRRIDVRDTLRKRDDGITFDIYPLLTLAEDVRDYAAIGQRLLGSDSFDAKKLALALIERVADSFRRSDWVAYRPGCGSDFVRRIEAPLGSADTRLLCWDLLIEFGCVIAAQGIFPRSSDRERYMRIRRTKWMMPLQSAEEKEVVFALYGGFLRELQTMQVVSSDQVVSDYLNYLNTFYWDVARAKEGYDVVFVDETHLFNAQERLVFHNLLRDADAPPRVVMALDPKQSPRETFTAVNSDSDEEGTNIFARARLPNSGLIDLTEVFRYTPQIQALISTLLSNAPALDLDQDWEVPVGSSRLPDGPVPKVKVVRDQVSIFQEAISSAMALSKETARGATRRTAILCLNDERFVQYHRAAAAQFDDDVIIITSRDDTDKLRYAGRRIVLSMPEYVAGLQFGAVVVVDANRDEVPDAKNNGYAVRRFLSELYLGASRAERHLLILASRDRGGISPFLIRAKRLGLLEEDD